IRWTDVCGASRRAWVGPAAVPPFLTFRCRLSDCRYPGPALDGRAGLRLGLQLTGSACSGLTSVGQFLAKSSREYCRLLRHRAQTFQAVFRAMGPESSSSPTAAARIWSCGSQTTMVVGRDK